MEIVLPNQQQLKKIKMIVCDLDETLFDHQKMIPQQTAQYLIELQKKGYPDRVGYLILDIDNFKTVNDQYGHQAGDEILKMILKIMKETFCEHTIYCRWGGEEFTAFLHCQHDYLEYVEKLRHNIDKAVLCYGDHNIHVTVSIGLCVAKNMSQHELRKLELLSDDCLYKAKQGGKNKVVSCTI